MVVYVDLAFLCRACHIFMNSLTYKCMYIYVINLIVLWRAIFSVISAIHIYIYFIAVLMFSTINVVKIS